MYRTTHEALRTIYGYLEKYLVRRYIAVSNRVLSEKNAVH